MATATKTTIKTDVPEFAQTLRDELITNVKQAQKISLDATTTFVKAVSALHVQSGHRPAQRAARLRASVGERADPGEDGLVRFSESATMQNTEEPESVK